jgi:hypothetical protein
MRGSSPGRARDAYQRSGDFQAGHQKRGGRQKGTPNFFSADLKRALFEAASRIGRDGSGKDGLKGYLRWVSRHHPVAFCSEFFVRVLPWEHHLADSPAEPLLTPVELDQGVRQYMGKRTAGAGRTLTTDPAPRSATAAGDWTGRDDLVGQLMHVAVADPKAFCRLLAACLPVPKKRRGRAMRPPNDPPTVAVVLSRGSLHGRKFDLVGHYFWREEPTNRRRAALSR